MQSQVFRGRSASVESGSVERPAVRDAIRSDLGYFMGGRALGTYPALFGTAYHKHAVDVITFWNRQFRSRPFFLFLVGDCYSNPCANYPSPIAGACHRKHPPIPESPRKTHLPVFGYKKNQYVSKPFYFFFYNLRCKVRNYRLAQNDRR